MKFNLTLIAIAIFFSSCLKQSIADSMINGPEKKGQIPANFSYEINGKLLTISIKDADNQGPGFRKLSCEKAAGFGYVLSAVGDGGEFVFTFFTDSLRVGNYTLTNSYGETYVTTFEGKLQYIYGSTDHVTFNITSNKNGHISGNFSGRLTTSIMQGNNSVYSVPGAILIKNGSFNNIPIIN